MGTNHDDTYEKESEDGGVDVSQPSDGRRPPQDAIAPGAHDPDEGVMLELEPFAGAEVPAAEDVVVGQSFQLD